MHTLLWAKVITAKCFLTFMTHEVRKLLMSRRVEWTLRIRSVQAWKLLRSLIQTAK
jgi:hypothetical protein